MQMISPSLHDSESSQLLRDTEIVAIDCFPALLRLHKPLIMSTYRLDNGPVLYIRIRSRDGRQGWGEAAANNIMSGETLTGMVAAFEQVARPRLMGRCALDRARLSRDLRNAIFANGAMLAAVDMALLDLVGHLRNVPVVELLGGAVREDVAVLRLIGGSGNLQADVAEAEQLYTEGFRAFKLKVGVAPVEQEIETVRVLRQALGPEVLLGADANMGWNVSTAVRFAQGACQHQLAFLEQPVAAGDVARLVNVTASSTVPISIDESLHGVSDLLAHVRAHAIQGISLKSIKLGGITPLVATATVADALGLSVNLAMMMESGLASAAMVHAACAIGQIDWGLSLGSLWIANAATSEPVVCGGMVKCPRGAGLGITVDERRIKALAP